MCRSRALLVYAGYVSHYRLVIYVIVTVLALVINYLLGKDMAWDTMNYHLYAGFSASTNRLSQDYFAAGPQAYFNPYIYLPFYRMVALGLSSLEISSLLTLVHSGMLWLTLELAISVCPSNDPLSRLQFGAWAVVFAFVNPILIQQIGSTYADITTAEIVLGGWVLLASAVHTASFVRVIAAGFLLGAASALKLTNSVHAVSGFFVLIMLPLNLGGKARYGSGFVIFLIMGFVLVALPWSTRLEQMFGNPLFPLMNGLFRSAEFTTEFVKHFRFIPNTLSEGLWRPFAMVDPVNMVHEELRAPDLRYAALFLLIGLCLVCAFWRHLRRLPMPWVRPETVAPRRVLVALCCGFMADWIMWLLGSGNSRYFLPMASVCAVLVVGLAFRLFTTHFKIRNYILITLLATQVIQLFMGTEFRWNPVAWDRRWFNIILPEKLVDDPSLYLTIGVQSNSFLAPYLSKNAGLINISGEYTLGSKGANGARIQALINRFSPHLRTIVQGVRLYQSTERREPTQSQIDATLRRFNLRIDPSDCVTIAVQGVPPDLKVNVRETGVAAVLRADTTYLLSCRVIHDSTPYETDAGQQLTVNLVLDRLEDACPKLFQPRRPYTDVVRQVAVRYYANTDLTAWVRNGTVMFFQSPGSDSEVKVGLESDWLRAPLHLDCGRRNGNYFANVLPTAIGR